MLSLLPHSQLDPEILSLSFVGTVASPRNDVDDTARLVQGDRDPGDVSNCDHEVVQVRCRDLASKNLMSRSQ